MSRLKHYTTLKSNREFARLYNRANKCHTHAILLFFQPGNKPKVGFTASKKVGNAVERNFAKRRMRALFLERQSELIQGSYILVAKKEILTVPFEKLQRSFDYTLRKAGALPK